MHISEGVLSAPVLLCGAAVAAAGIAAGLRRMDYDRLMTVALLSAAFFVGSLIHIPVGPASAHLILNGLLGAVLGWAAFPAIFTALLLQAVLFQYGGLTILGVNTATMASAAVLCFYLFSPLMRRQGRWRLLGGFCCGACGVLFAGLFTAASLAFSDEGFRHAAGMILVAHIPVMVVEGIITALTVSFLARARPEVLHMNAGKQR
ncbi:cobalamin (vitamin B12) biosynthesis CbiM protein [Oleidesulfovibrio alaskensis G20]|jgi:cobalt/nickel transport system permease protein|uniref:Cobalamin (Vitamin B12) biosynthesis CbiM protein n=1 Tax=Oleidesulfovibrio alaskensis (strain ATCC BAA-1058 / DSM 17464 / G20) TaxID=207559 RepID=Q313A5_OLEA2|nr:cobalt transporter CbiM [Oleidesulfovibrio alaskensis]ABB37991.1 cobalamin (vitamin B12) biosynthesis CbiM protein [Oleidesulfovibrio alaskensis G20]MBG0774783.1 cobalt transporter CbiM [Oleidesulfovibrio alaskensis]MBL3582578.1 cobalt transporter CbiM [Oleidesulfovibrio alaskensis]